jgi:regulator of Ty1 transposition protein 109
MADDTSKSLADELSDVLPQGHSFSIHHISTPPTKCDSIYSPPPNTRPDHTYRESHFLQVSIPHESSQVFILAIECLIYTTRHLTTIFVSKADSTGYLSLLRLGKEYESPLRSVATTFVGYLVKHRMRPGTKLVVDLFARASDQYLYPGSVENDQKHVSDDRQLVKWWCRVLDPVLQAYAAKPPSKNLFDQSTNGAEEKKTTAHAYLVVPGEDTITTFLPPTVRLNPILRARWTHGHPLLSLSRHAGAPPRCLIPHFPDDPKGRYLVELDDELPDANSQNAGTQDASPSKRGTGEWKSVRSLDQFWEMMAHRSECAAGRLVGFIWLVFEPVGEKEEFSQESQESQTSIVPQSPSRLPQSQPLQTPRKKPSKSRALKGPIPTLLPRILRASSSSFETVPPRTPWYIWPSTSRSHLVLPDNAYTKATEMLLRLDFATLSVAVQSTRAWVGELSVLGGVDISWGDIVEGKAAPRAAVSGASKENGATNGVNVMLGVKRKRPVDTATNGITTPAQAAAVIESPAVNVIGVRKKPKKVQPFTVTPL